MRITPRAVWSLLAILGLFITQTMGYTASAEELTAGGLMLAGIGDIELKDINEALHKQGQIFEEFKKKNDERLESIEKKGWAPADLTEQVGKLSDAMTKLDKEILEVQKKANRLNAGEADQEAKAEFKSALDRFARKGDISLLEGIHKKAMNSSSDPDGGFLIVPELDGMIERVVPTVSALARLARTVTIGTAKYSKLTKKSGMSVSWPGDGNTSGESTAPTYAKVEIDVFPAEVEPWVENETLEDTGLEVDLGDEAAIAFAEGLGLAFVSGNGVGKPRGILGYTPVANASYAWGKVGYILSGKSSAFASVAPADKLIDLQHALKSQYRSGAAWLTNDTTLGTMRQIKDGSGSYYLWQPDPAAAFGGRFLGSPVEVDDNMSALAAASYSLAYGDFRKAYTVVNRTGIQLIRDALTQKGVTKFNFRKRVGGGITNFEAIKLMKFATS